MGYTAIRNWLKELNVAVIVPSTFNGIDRLPIRYVSNERLFIVFGYRLPIIQSDHLRSIQPARSAADIPPHPTPRPENRGDSSE